MQALGIAACRCHTNKLRLEKYLFAESSRAHTLCGGIRTMGNSGNVRTRKIHAKYFFNEQKYPRRKQQQHKNARIFVEAYPITLKLYTHLLLPDGSARFHLVHYVCSYSINVVVA